MGAREGAAQLMNTVRGRALHSGLECEVRFFRSDGPVTFRRAGTDIPALAPHVVSTVRSTVLGSGGTTVGTVEHLLAALSMRGWWEGLLVEVSAGELPILDGSAAEWLTIIDSLGPAPARPEPLTPARAVRVSDGSGVASAEPGPASLRVQVDYPHPLIGRQEWAGTPADYPHLADARTFGFLSEVEDLKRRGLAHGATVDNCIVFDAHSTLGPPPAADEPVRHKALDALGDLHLLGRPLEARVVISHGSHALHAKLLAELAGSAAP